MTPEAFEQSLRDNLRREPFQPFVVEFVDGREMIIDAPHTVALGGGGAGFITPEYDIVSFNCDEVRAIRQASHEITS